MNRKTNQKPVAGAWRLQVLEGVDAGLTAAIPTQGLRLGRASANDLTLKDPLLSRHHCRLGFRGDTLWVTDLASANETLVNGKTISETALKNGDKILIGDTQLLVCGPENAPSAASEKRAADVPTGTDGAPSPNGSTSAKALPSKGAETPLVDLGFETPAAPAPRSHGLRPLLWAVGAAVLLLLGATLILRLPDAEDSTHTLSPPDPSYLPLVLRYEKIEATPDSIFRYEMSLTPEMLLSIRIDDLSENRHVRREGLVATNLVRELAREIENSGFFALSDRYEGIQRESSLNRWDLTVVMDSRVKRCRVSNRIEPEPFREIRERIETFGMNELGIWAIQFSREKLLEMALDALTRARNKFDERGIAYGNTAEAIQRYKEAAFYLETVDPKPDFHTEIVSGRAEAEEELERRYTEQRFLANRALNMREWQIAQRELRILMELIPDRNDPRHVEAMGKLLDVENRLKSRRTP